MTAPDETARARLDGACTFEVGKLKHGDGDRWWRVELVGRGVEVVHLQRPLRFTLDEYRLAKGITQALVREAGVPDVEARAFDALAARYKAPGWRDGRLERDPSPASTSDGSASARKLAGAAYGAEHLLRTLERQGA